MSKLYQTDPRLHERYHKTGCNFLAHLGMCQSDVKHYLSPQQTGMIADYLINSGYLTYDLSMHKKTSPYALFKETFKVLGYPNRRGEQIGQIINGQIMLWKHVTEPFFEGVIAQLILCNGALHFVECNRNFEVIYNPHPGNNQYRVYNYLLYHFWVKE
ncbi:hypothetical protein ES708_21723 [subsurface metagenome]